MVVGEVMVGEINNCRSGDGSACGRNGYGGGVGEVIVRGSGCRGDGGEGK